MDDVRYPVLVESTADRGRIRHVAFEERDPRPLLLGQHEPDSRVVGAEVEPDRLLAQVEERLERPRAEAAKGTGNERPLLSQAARPGRR